MPNITQVISGRAEIKINTIVEIQSPSLYQCILLPHMVIAGIGSITDQGPYLQCSENSIKANVETTPPTGCFPAITEQDRNTEANFFLGEKVLTQFTTNIVLKALRWPFQTFLIPHSNLGHIHPTSQTLLLPSFTRESDLNLMTLLAFSDFLFSLTLAFSPIKPVHPILASSSEGPSMPQF